MGLLIRAQVTQLLALTSPGRANCSFQHISFPVSGLPQQACGRGQATAASPWTVSIKSGLKHQCAHPSCLLLLQTHCEDNEAGVHSVTHEFNTVGQLLWQSLSTLDPDLRSPQCSVLPHNLLTLFSSCSKIRFPSEQAGMGSRVHGRAKFMTQPGLTLPTTPRQRNFPQFS